MTEDRKSKRLYASEAHRQIRDDSWMRYTTILHDLYPDENEFSSGDRVRVVVNGKLHIGMVGQFSPSMRNYMVQFNRQWSRRFYADEMTLVGGGATHD